MHPSLIKLMQIRFRARLRQIGRSLKQPKGWIFGGLGLLAFAMSVLPSTIFAAQNRVPRATGFLEMASLAMFALCVVTTITGSGRWPQFKPAEVQFLFSGPYTRREILSYKLVSDLCMGSFSALIFSLFVLRYASRWIYCFVGMSCFILLLQLVNASVAQLRRLSAESFVTSRQRNMAGLAGIAAVASSLAFFSRVGANAASPLELARSIHATLPGRVLLAPFDALVHVISAERFFPDFAGWLTVCFMMCGLLAAVVLRIDVDYFEQATVTSETLQRRIEQVRRGGSIWTAQRIGGWRVPRLPWLWGAGPLVWRQFTTVLRTVRTLLMFVVVTSVIMVPAFSIVGRPLSASIVTYFAVMFAFVLPRQLPIGFRTDLDHLDWLKSLPIRPTVVAAGQLAGSVLILCTLQFLFLGVAYAFLRDSQPYLLAGCAFLPPLNLLWLGIDTLQFLLFPSRMAMTATGGIEMMGRSMVELLVRGLLILASCGSAASAGFLVYFLSGSIAAGLIVAWMAMAACGVVMVVAVGWAFDRFDISRDTPA